MVLGEAMTTYIATIRTNTGQVLVKVTGAHSVAGATGAVMQAMPDAEIIKVEMV